MRRIYEAFLWILKAPVLMLMGAFTASTVAHDAGRSSADLESFRMGITKIWKGDQVVIKTDGYAYSAYVTGAAGDQFIGVAAETVDNRYLIAGDADSGAAAVGDRNINVWQEGVFEFDIASSTIETALGLAVYNERGATGTPRLVTVTAGASGVQVGVIVGIIGTVTAFTKCRVRITAMSAVAT